nr:uncharacterized protein LOC118681064 [Bactrocera oleae]
MLADKVRLNPATAEAKVKVPTEKTHEQGSAVNASRFSADGLGILLMQKHWIYKGEVRDLKTESNKSSYHKTWSQCRQRTTKEQTSSWQRPSFRERQHPQRPSVTWWSTAGEITCPSSLDATPTPITWNGAARTATNGANQVNLLLKIMEKIIDFEIRSKVLKAAPLHA